jgi:hypothetical protein
LYVYEAGRCEIDDRDIVDEMNVFEGDSLDGLSLVSNFGREVISDEPLAELI